MHTLLFEKGNYTFDTLNDKKRCFHQLCNCYMWDFVSLRSLKIYSWKKNYFYIQCCDMVNIFINIFKIYVKKTYHKIEKCLNYNLPFRILNVASGSVFVLKPCFCKRSNIGNWLILGRTFSVLIQKFQF